MREPVIVLRDLTPETRAPLLSSPKAGTRVRSNVSVYNPVYGALSVYMTNAQKAYHKLSSRDDPIP